MNFSDKIITDVKHLIPQKFPFVMVDCLLSFSENSVTSSFAVKEDNIFYNNGVFTEPGLIENMAQTVALHTGYDFFLRKEEAPVGYIGSIKKIEINKLPELHEVITTKVNILQEFMGVTMVEITVFDTSLAVVATGNMKTVIAK